MSGVNRDKDEILKQVECTGQNITEVRAVVGRDAESHRGRFLVTTTDGDGELWADPGDVLFQTYDRKWHSWPKVRFLREYQEQVL